MHIITPIKRVQFQCEEAYQNTCQALEAKKEGDLQGALQAHAVAAKAFRECAVLIKEKNVNMANSLLLLSQTQAKSALALKRIVKQQQNPASPHENDDDANRGRRRGSQVLTQKDRLRAAVRGALVTRNEEDISDSAFLGKATKGPMTSSMANAPNSVAKANDTGSNSNAPNAAVSGGANTSSSQSSSGGPSQNNPQHNPVDDM